MIGMITLWNDLRVDWMLRYEHSAETDIILSFFLTWNDLSACFSTVRFTWSVSTKRRGIDIENNHTMFRGAITLWFLWRRIHPDRCGWATCIIAYAWVVGKSILNARPSYFMSSPHPIDCWHRVLNSLRNVIVTKAHTINASSCFVMKLVAIIGRWNFTSIEVSIASRKNWRLCFLWLPSSSFHLTFKDAGIHWRFGFRSLSFIRSFVPSSDNQIDWIWCFLWLSIVEIPDSAKWHQQYWWVDYSLYGYSIDCRQCWCEDRWEYSSTSIIQLVDSSYGRGAIPQALLRPIHYYKANQWLPYCKWQQCNACSRHYSCHDSSAHARNEAPCSRGFNRGTSQLQHTSRLFFGSSTKDSTR